ncbi:MAG: hypothetical protein Q9162_001144 [Coniocarpon cinnabarinum]
MSSAQSSVASNTGALAAAAASSQAAAQQAARQQQAAMQAAIARMGPPYPPMTQSLGTPPSPIPDAPVTAVFLVLFLFTGLMHMRLFVGNKKKEHKFVFSAAMFAFCTIRVISTSLRLGWAYHQQNIKLAIATQIFVAAGTVILFIINLFFTQRLMRARHPHIGWHAPFKVFIPGIFVGLTILGIIMVIVVVVQSFYTLNPNTHRIDTDIQKAVLTYFTFVAFLPIPIVAVMLLIPRRTYIDKFGSGRFRTKIGVLLLSSSVLTLGAGFRCGTTFLAPTPARAPTPWYFSKACFYCFDFLVELVVVIAYAAVRVDRRFYVPPEAHGEGEYSGEVVQQPPADDDFGVFTLNPDGRTLSLIDGRTFSLADKKTFSMYDASSASFTGGPYGRAEIDGAESINSQSYMTINRRSGRYEMHSMSRSSLDPRASEGDFHPSSDSGVRTSTLRGDTLREVNEGDGDADASLQNPGRTSQTSPGISSGDRPSDEYRL